MSRNSSNKLWQKYLSKSKKRKTAASESPPSTPEEEPSPTITLFVITYECSVCLKKIMEVRSNACQHTSCLDCVPIQCSVDCRNSLFNTIHRPELYDKVVAGYEMCCSDLVHVVPKKEKRYYI